MDKKTIEKEVKKRFKEEIKDLNEQGTALYWDINGYVKHAFEYGKKIGMFEAEMKKGCCKDDKKKDCKCAKSTKGEINE